MLQLWVRGLLLGYRGYRATFVLHDYMRLYGVQQDMENRCRYV